MSARSDPGPPASVALFDELARRGYDEHFAAPHRKAYDDLAWETIVSLLPDRPARVVDAGCGSARWASRLVSLGHRVVGIEQAPEMVASARARHLPADRFTLIEGDLLTVEHPALRQSCAEVVLAMGSVQYTADPQVALARLARWAVPGGVVAVVADSLVALVLELLAAGQVDEALARASTRRGCWRSPAGRAELHLFDRASLTQALGDAGLTDVVVRGLLVGSSGFGREGLSARLSGDPSASLTVERALAASPALADAGKQLLGIGWRR